MKYNRKQLKKFIIDNLIGKQKSIPYNRQTFRWYELRNLTDYYNSIFAVTNYLPDNCKFNERCYQIVNNITTAQLCPSCNNPINYVDFTNGYRSYCKPSCSTKGKKQIDILIEKYGEIIGTKKYNTMVKNKTQTEERFIELYGESEGKRRWKSRNKKCKLNSSLQGYINRYGKDQGKIEYLKCGKKMSEAQTLDAKIQKHGKEKGTKIFNETIRKKAQTLDRFIEIYGDEDGLRKFENYKSKQFKKNASNVSKESLNFFKPILDFILENADYDIISNTYIGSKNNQEYFLIDKELNKTYFYDLTIEPLKLIFEYNGVAFHPNKNKLNEEEWLKWKTPFSNISADEKFKYDQRKLDIARKNGFDIIEIWSDDNLESIQNKCKTIIETKMNEIYTTMETI